MCNFLSRTVTTRTHLANQIWFIQTLYKWTGRATSTVPSPRVMAKGIDRCRGRGGGKWRRGRGNGVCLATTSPQNDTGKKREHFEHILLSANWQYYIPARPSFPPSTLTNLKKIRRERQRESEKGWKVLWAAYEGEYSKIIQPFVRVPLCVNKAPFVEYGFFADWRIHYGDLLSYVCLWLYHCIRVYWKTSLIPINCWLLILSEMTV